MQSLPEPAAGGSAGETRPQRTFSDDAATGQLLSEVPLPEDRQLIVDVLNAIKACRQPHTLCTSWQVAPSVHNHHGWVVTAYLPRPSQQQPVIEITHDDMHIIECVNLLRVRVSVAATQQGMLLLKVYITGHAAPLSFNMYDPIRVRAKRTLVDGGGASSNNIASMLGQGAAWMSRQVRRKV